MKQVKRWRIEEATVDVGTKADTTNWNPGEVVECPSASGSERPNVRSPSPLMPAISEPHITAAPLLIDLQPLPSPLKAAASVIADFGIADQNLAFPQHAPLSTIIPSNADDLGPLMQLPTWNQPQIAAIETIKVTHHMSLFQFDAHDVSVRLSRKNTRPTSKV